MGGELYLRQNSCTACQRAHKGNRQGRVCSECISKELNRLSASYGANQPVAKRKSVRPYRRDGCRGSPMVRAMTPPCIESSHSYRNSRWCELSPGTAKLYRSPREK